MEFGGTFRLFNFRLNDLGKRNVKNFEEWESGDKDKDLDKILNGLENKSFPDIVTAFIVYEESDYEYSCEVVVFSNLHSDSERKERVEKIRSKRDKIHNAQFFYERNWGGVSLAAGMVAKIQIFRNKDEKIKTLESPYYVPHPRENVSPQTDDME